MAGECVWQGVCMAGGHAFLGGGACVVKGGMCGEGGHAWQRVGV